MPPYQHLLPLRYKFLDVFYRLVGSGKLILVSKLLNLSVVLKTPIFDIFSSKDSKLKH